MCSLTRLVIATFDTKDKRNIATMPWKGVPLITRKLSDTMNVLAVQQVKDIPH